MEIDSGIRTHERLNNEKPLPASFLCFFKSQKLSKFPIASFGMEHP